MSDEPTRPGEIAQPRERGPLGHLCEHTGCGKDAGWGFARPSRPSHWFCFSIATKGSGSYDPAAIIATVDRLSFEPREIPPAPSIRA